MAYTADGFFPSYKLVKQTEYDDSFENIWNKYIKELDLPFRAFHIGAKSTIGSRTRWMHFYLERHRRDFGIFHEQAHIEEVFERFSFILYAALSKLAAEGITNANQRLGTNYNARLTCWRFIDPPTNLLELSGMRQRLDDDSTRRKEKAKALKALDATWAETKRKAIYLLKDPAQLRALDKTLQKALCTVEETIELMAESNGP